MTKILGKTHEPKLLGADTHSVSLSHIKASTSFSISSISTSVIMVNII